jgi:hypothetical protein
MFLGIILRVLRLEVLYGFISGFPLFSFTVYSNFTVEKRQRLCEFENISKRLCEIEEIDISRQSCRGDCE